MFSGVGARVGVRVSWAVIVSGRLARKEPRQLIVRGIPLKLMHFSPTSRMSSAVSRDWVGVVVLARLYRAVRDSGEFIVIVAAVWWVLVYYVFSSMLSYVLTDSATHDGCEICFACAVCWIFW